MNGFVRSTHRSDGSFRQDMEPYWSNLVGIAGLFHWLDKTPITFDQIMECIMKDDVNFENKPSREEVCLWLINEIEYDLIRVVKIEQYTITAGK